MPESRFRPSRPAEGRERAIRAAEPRDAALNRSRPSYRVRRWLLVAFLASLFLLPVGGFLLIWLSRPVVMPLDRETESVALAFSPDGEMLVGASHLGLTGELAVWDVKTRRRRQTLELAQGANSVAFSPDGRRLAIACNRSPIRREKAGVAAPGHVCIYDTVTWQQTAKLPHNHGVYVVAFAPDGKRLVAGGGKAGDSGSVAEAYVWDVQTWQKVFELEGLKHRVEALAFSPDGETLAIGGDGRVRLFNSSGQPRTTFEVQQGAVTSLVFCHEGHLAVATASGQDKGAVVEWDLEGRKYRTWPALTKERRTQSICCVGRGGQPLVMANDGEATGECGNIFPDYGHVAVLDLQSGKQLTAWEESAEARFGSLAISPDGKTLAVGIRRYEQNHVKFLPMPKR